MAAVYVIHLDPPYRHARHYIGWTDGEDVAERLGTHQRGRGSPLLRAAVAAGSRLDIAHVFVGADRHFERKLKNRKDVRSWCRCCGVAKRPTPKITAQEARS